MTSTTDDATLAQQLATFAVDAATNGIPSDVVTSVGQRTLDILGLCVAAHRLPTSAAAIGHVLDQGGHPQATIVGHPERVTAAQAAFANGVLAHSLDYDDTHLPSVLHPSASVVPAALAAAEHAGASGELTVRAIAVGLEVAVRLGMAGYDQELGNSVFFEHGQHATSITGAMGSAVAASLAYGLDEKGVLDGLGLTASMASGIIEANRTGGTVKRLRERGVTPAQVAEVVVGVASSTVRTIGEPIEVKRAPDTGYQAQFSGPYAFTAGLFGGGGLGTALDDYSDELAQDPARRALMAKVSVVASDVCDEIYPFQFPAVVTVTTTSGEVLVQEVLTNRGGPQPPLSDDELATKFRDNVAGRLSDEVAAAVRDDVLALHLAPDLASVLNPLSTTFCRGDSQ